MKATENSQQEGTRADKNTDTFRAAKSALRTRVDMPNSRLIPWTIKWNLYFNSLLPL